MLRTRRLAGGIPDSGLQGPRERATRYPQQASLKLPKLQGVTTNKAAILLTQHNGDGGDVERKESEASL